MKSRMLFAIALCIVLGLSAFAQDRGTFTGTVTDPTGSVIPNVDVTIVQVQTNQKSETVTNETGQYRVPNLPVGEYGYGALWVPGITTWSVTKIDE